MQETHNSSTNSIIILMILAHNIVNQVNGQFSFKRIKNLDFSRKSLLNFIANQTCNTTVTGSFCIRY